MLYCSPAVTVFDSGKRMKNSKVSSRDPLKPRSVVSNNANVQKQEASLPATKANEPISPSEPYKRRDIFFTNLLLLGFKPDAIAVGQVKSSVAQSVQMDKNMFARGSGNAKAMEAVSYFLFHTYDPDLAKEVSPTRTRCFI
jgi:hypothetical protein